MTSIGHNGWWSLMLLAAVVVSGEVARINLGILHPNTKHAIPVAQLAIANLFRDNVLSNDTVDLRVVAHQTKNDDACHTSAIGMAELVLNHDCIAIIGPNCNEGMFEVASMAADWNIPVIAYDSPHTEFHDKHHFPTLSRVSVNNVEELSKATLQFLRHYNWRRIVLILSEGEAHQEKATDITEAPDIFTVETITIAKHSSALSIVTSGILEPIKLLARVVVVLVGQSARDNQAVISALHQVQIRAPDYIVVLMRLHSDTRIIPWFSDAEHKVIDPMLKEAFTDTFLIDLHHVTEYSIKLFFDDLPEISNTAEQSVGLLPFYDAVYLYGVAVAKLLNESSSVEEGIANINNGSLLWHETHLTQFRGAVRNVQIDQVGERVLSYDAFFVSKDTTDAPINIVELQQMRIQDCDTGHSHDSSMSCYYFKASTAVQPADFWPYDAGRLPADTPACGFDGTGCWTLLQIIALVAAAMLLTVATAFGFYARKKRLEAELQRMAWRIHKEDISFRENLKHNSRSMTLSNADSARSASSVDQKSFKSVTDAVTAVIRKTGPAILNIHKQNRQVEFSRSQLIQINEIKKINHDQLTHFIGISFNQDSELITIWSLEKRGTLQDMLMDDSFDLDVNFKTSFIKDVTKGLDFLHSSAVGYHGRLSTISCMVSSYWSVKLHDFGLRNILADLTSRREITVKNDESVLGDGTRITEVTGFTSGELIQFAPELLRELGRNLDAKGEAAVLRGTVKGDIYSLGMIIYQIYYRREPYDHEKATEILKKQCSGSGGGRRAHEPPRIPEDVMTTAKVLTLFELCWSEEPDERPAVKRVKAIVDANFTGKSNIMDHMMSMMEQYANNLESLVRERTAALEEAQNRADTLLSQLLPRTVMTELKAGRQVAPMMYDSATVLFTDIVGFTNLCSSSTPLQVVTFLNELYTQFDNLIAIHDCYKVETIGDAYMVVSGVPTENGVKHIQEIAELSMGMLEAIRTYKVPHMPSLDVAIRLGFHSGSVATGVVGLAMPKYCLFGDTVNMASRMESSGEPMKIQLSAAAKDFLVAHYPEFITSERGVMPIKGKGNQRTFWLISKVAQ